MMSLNRLPAFVTAPLRGVRLLKPKEGAGLFLIALMPPFSSRWAGVALFLGVFFSPSAGALTSKAKKIIQEVSVTPAYFNPSLAQKETITFKVSRPGEISAVILDRDHFPVRKIPHLSAAAGAVTIRWDGKDDAGAVVPDEAYSVRIEFTRQQVHEVYDPAENFTPQMESPKPQSYSRVDGVLAYSLSRPSRVHIQAGQARLDPKTNQADGPVLKTVLDRQPRIAGPVIENWDGYDESGAIFVPALVNFRMSIMATALPENAMIAIGNQKEDFLHYAALHRPAAAMAARKMAGNGHTHHAGLNAFEDTSPPLRLEWLEGSGGRAKQTERFRQLRISVAETPELAAHFLSQPNELVIFLDEEQIQRIKQPRNPTVVDIDLKTLNAGEHRVVANWSSRFGPVAVNAMKIVIAQSPIPNKEALK